MFTFLTFSAWIERQLHAAGVQLGPDVGAPGLRLGTIDTGPITAAKFDQPGPVLILHRAPGGPGYRLEGVLDYQVWVAYVVGAPGDYDGAEGLAMTIDRLFEADCPANARFIDRVGGGPANAVLDAGNRYHFSCSYIVAAISAAFV